MRFSLPLFFSFLLSLLFSCGGNPTPAFSEFHSVPVGGWYNDHVVEFDVGKDSLLCDSALYDITLVVRNTERCKTQRLWLALETLSIDSPLKKDTVGIPLCDSIGRWMGKGGHGVYESSVLLRRAVRIPSGMIIAINHADTAECIKGISDIGIIISPSGISENSKSKVLKK